MYAPAPMTVQVPVEHYHPWLRLVARMARDPKNHFVVMNPGTRTQVEYILGSRLPVIPVLALYVNATYSGWSSHEVVVHDRTGTLLTQVLCALTSSGGYPLRFAGHFQTDRRYSTFA